MPSAVTPSLFSRFRYASERSDERRSLSRSLRPVALRSSEVSFGSRASAETSAIGLFERFSSRSSEQPESAEISVMPRPERSSDSTDSVKSSPPRDTGREPFTTPSLNTRQPGRAFCRSSST